MRRMDMLTSETTVNVWPEQHGREFFRYPFEERFLNIWYISTNQEGDLPLPTSFQLASKLYDE